MLRKPFFKEQIFFIILIALVHIVGMQLYWYWHFLWLDIVMHFLGGLWVALASFWILGVFNGHAAYIQSKKQALVFGVVAALFVGFFWEIFEYVADIAVTSEAYWPDTILDFIMDASGGLVAGLYAWSVLRKYKSDVSFSIKAKVTLGTYEE